MDAMFNPQWSYIDEAGDEFDDVFYPPPRLMSAEETQNHDKAFFLEAKQRAYVNFLNSTGQTPAAPSKPAV